MRARVVGGGAGPVAVGATWRWPVLPVLAERDAEERRGALVSRVRNSLRVHFRNLVGCEGVDIHLHAAPLYNSTFRFDEEMFVTLHLSRLGNGGIFDRFAQHFENVWTTSTAWEPPE